MGAYNRKDLRAFVRYDGNGRVVAGSLVLRRRKPKVGKWVEITTYECCEPTTTTTTTSSTTSTTSTTTTSTSTSSTTTTTTTAAPLECSTLGRSGGFVVLGSSTVTNTGATVVTGDLGLSPGTSVTGFPPGIVLGTQHITDASAANAQIDALAAFTALNLLTPTGSVAADIGGTTITPGIYSTGSGLGITGTVTLNGGGNPNAVFIFQIPSTFIPAVNAIVSLTNSAQAGNVYWVVGSSATLNTNSAIKGNIIAQASISLNTGAALIGRALALTGAVTLDDNDVTGANCTINPIA